MLCDVCGREILGKPKRVIIEGAKVIACAECAKLGSGYWEPEDRPISARKAASGALEGLRTRPAVKSQVYGQKRQKISPTEDLEVIDGFGSIVRRARERMGLTIEDLSRKIGEKESVIKKIESGKIVPDMRIAAKLEHALKIKLLVRPSEIEVNKISKSPRLEKEVTLGEIIQLKGGRKGGESGDEGHNSAS